MRAIDADACESYFWEHLDDNGMAAAMNAINDMPTIEPQRKKGKWLASDDMYETGICSCCRWDSQEPFDYAIANFHYCPNCGADMREEND